MLARHHALWVLAVLTACGRTADVAPPAPASSAPAPATASAPPPSSAPAPPAPPAPRPLGAFGIECGQPNDPPLAEGSLRLPAPFVVERADVDAILQKGTPRYVTEAWKALADGCEHQYQAHLGRAGARRRFEDLARDLGVAPSISGMRFRLEHDALFVMVEPASAGENVIANILHRGVDTAACLRAAVDALPPNLRSTNALGELGVKAKYASIVREEGTQPWCHADFEWSDKTIVTKLRSWIEQRGHKIDDRDRFDWDDGGDGYVLKWSASFNTRHRRSQ